MSPVRPNATHRAALERLAAWPRAPLAHLPTPLLRAERLGDAIGCEALWLKMDAETGFALGGNKVRKLELVLAPDRIAGVTHLITAGGPQSNHCRVTAAFAARHGLACVLVAQGPEPERPTGNALLHRLFGAEIVTVADRSLRAPAMQEVAERITAKGGRPLVVPIGASTGLGSLGYALAFVELIEQLDAVDDGRSDTLLFVSASSCGTLAGLLLGVALMERWNVRLFGVSADASAEELRATTRSLAAEGAELLGASPDLDRVELETIDDQVGDGYGISTPASVEALERFARLEGVVLDPTYTAKAAAGMIARITERPPTSEQRVVFVHTGGAPGLLA